MPNSIYRKPKTPQNYNVFEVLLWESKDNTPDDLAKKDGFVLPFDVQISIDGDKMISETQILDGVSVYEKVTRKAADIEFAFTFRDLKNFQLIGKEVELFSTGKTLPVGTPQRKLWIFPMDDIVEYIQNIWIKDTVLNVTNSLLNKIGIDKIIVGSYTLTTIRGSIDVPVTLKCKENVYSINSKGGSLILS